MIEKIKSHIGQPKKGKVYWREKELNTYSEDFQSFIREVYNELFKQNREFREALLSTKGRTLWYDEREFTEINDYFSGEDFCKILTEIRDSYQSFEYLENYSEKLENECGEFYVDWRGLLNRL